MSGKELTLGVVFSGRLDKLLESEVKKLQDLVAGLNTALSGIKKSGGVQALAGLAKQAKRSGDALAEYNAVIDKAKVKGEQYVTTLSELTGENVSLYNALAKFYNRNLTNTLYTMQDFRNDAVKFSTLTENLKYYYAANNGANNLAILHAPIYVNQGDVVLDYKQADALFNSKNELNTNEEVNIASTEIKNDVKEDIKTVKL